MKISELIKELSERLTEEGDLEVKVPERYAYGGCCCCGPTYDEDLEEPYTSVENAGTIKGPHLVLVLRT